MEWMWRSSFLFFIIQLFSVVAFAQDTTTTVSIKKTTVKHVGNAPATDLKQFDEKRWEKLTKELDYNENLKKKKKENDLPSLPSFNFNQGVLKVVVVTLVILALVFLLWKIFGNKKFLRNSKIKNGEFSFLDEAEENLEESDLERFLREALEKKQYKIAVRIYYLMSIKELMLQNFIVWKKNKTNFEYLTEMRERQEFEHFHSLTRAFEIVWYGDVEIEEKEFAVLSPSFSNFIRSIKSYGQK